MREAEVRARVESFLKSTARQVVIPASMGLGLALIGCGDTAGGPLYSAVMPTYDADVSSRDASVDQPGPPVILYGVMMPLDASLDLPVPSSPDSPASSPDSPADSDAMDALEAAGGEGRDAPSGDVERPG